jgi:E3 ubiquitin-protein ligase SHPRH
LNRGTLIISPATIIHQWHSEIKRHAPNLSVYLFNTGREQIDYAAYDIVLTTYSDLRSEYYACFPFERSLRHERKYDKRYSPLVSTVWWRIIVDEAQEVSFDNNRIGRIVCIYRYTNGQIIKKSSFFSSNWNGN